MYLKPIYQKLKESICSKLNIRPQDFFCFPDEKGVLFEFNHPLQTIDNIAAIVQETFKNMKEAKFNINTKKNQDGSYDLEANINNERYYSSQIYSPSKRHFIINLYRFNIIRVHNKSL